MSKFHLVISNGDGEPFSTQKVAKETVVDGMYENACKSLTRKILREEVNIGYVRMYFAGKMIKEFHAEQQPTPTIPTLGRATTHDRPGGEE
jgi:hypothetical protein